MYSRPALSSEYIWPTGSAGCSMLCCSLPCGRREWRKLRHNWTSLINVQGATGLASFKSYQTFCVCCDCPNNKTITEILPLIYKWYCGIKYIHKISDKSGIHYHYYFTTYRDIHDQHMSLNMACIYVYIYSYICLKYWFVLTLIKCCWKGMSSPIYCNRR